MVRNIAPFYRELEPPDFYLLSGLEHGMRFAEWVHPDRLPEFADLAPDEVEYRLNRCMDRDLIERNTIQYEGYRLRFAGYDALALRTFTERDTIDAFGAPLGVGKESDVYEVRSYKPLALKYHREGYTNFREVMREREYTADHEHVSWFYTARKAAEHEYSVLETLFPAVSVPRPIDHNRHAIIMEKMDGVELSGARLRQEQVPGVLDLIFLEIQAAYDAGCVHADLSEYNVFVSSDGVTLFDWPQAVPVRHENADERLQRDITNITNYFHRKYPQALPEFDIETIIEQLTCRDFDTIQAST